MTTETALAPFEPSNMVEADTLAKKLSASNLLPTALRQHPEDVLVTVLTGRELGLSPMQSIRALHVIEGRAVLSADMMVALCQRSPAVCESFRCVESTDAVATYETKRRGNAPVKMSFTIEQAKAANLTGRDNWKKYPAAMLRARCKSALARDVYPDLLAGVYDNDEVETKREAREAAVFEQHDVIDLEPVMTAPSEPSPVERLTAAIAAAESIDALTALVADIKALPEDQQKELRAAYGEKRLALGGAK